MMIMSMMLSILKWGNIDIVSNVKNLRCIDFEEMLNKINILILMIICIMCGWLLVIFCI